MKKVIRKYLLLPFSLIYGLTTELRNFLYDKEILPVTSFDIPIINIGNLSVGGTGKTPQVEYLIRLLKDRYKMAVISRGYKRKTKGFYLADHTSTPDKIGDEPFQIYQKFPEIILAVSEKRVPGIKKIINRFQPDIILLDDAYQHRSVKAGLNIVLTPYHDLFTDDFILPSGNLRECKHQIKRADLLIVTKSPEEIDREKIENKIRKFFRKDLFFSKIAYENTLIGKEKNLKIDDLKEFEVLVVTGIANPASLFEYLSKKSINFDSLKFGDHHTYSQKDVQQIKASFDKLKGNRKIILTTEKDYVKLVKTGLPVFYLPIKTEIENEELFNKKILEYVDS